MMNKERLEKAKKILNHIKGYGVYDGNDDIEIFEWLIGQAEQNKRYREHFNWIIQNSTDKYAVQASYEALEGEK